MVFKLVRTDTEDPCKIYLPVGSHLIGRGKLLDCDDKRVSRNHGELTVTDDAISIKALHQNPCFYKKKGLEETFILKQNCIESLNHGDKFGLLPNSYWYEILFCPGLDVKQSPEITIEDNTQPLEQTIAEDINGVIERRLESELFNIERNKAEATNERTEESSLLPTIAEPGSPTLSPRESDPGREEGSPSLLPPVSEDQLSTQPQIDPELPSIQAGGSPVKRSHSSEDNNEDVKRVKQEPDDGVPVKQEPEAQPGPSGDQGGNYADNSNNNPAGPMPQSPNKPPPVGRERCMYGARCYRRNPAHKAQFAHPSDSDWGEGPRGVCPYGAACRRRDPRHWRDHTHPPGTEPPPPHQPAQRRRKPKRERESSEENSGDDTPETSLIVTGKRARKVVKRPSYSDSELEEDEDPFKTDDEEDEWVPGSQSLVESQYTQDTQDD